MMRVAHCDGEGISRVIRLRIGLRQQHADHHPDLRLLAMPGAPTNWHFISISFDTENDTPAALKSYGERYHYNPAHWSFLTGPADKIAELAEASGASFQKDGPFYGHNFRTQIVDASQHLQMVFPITGDLSDGIVKEILKAAAATNSSKTQMPQ